MPYAVGNVIRHGRQRRGLKISELADRVRISKEHLDNVEAGRRPASIELLHRIAAELDIHDVDSLVAGPSRPASQAVA